MQRRELLAMAAGAAVATAIDVVAFGQPTVTPTCAANP
ncbi:MAG: hypothetical protein JWM63_5629 [Gammaproteobacteria bacterium]|jgi:hypothetical protein|nr:hypothetical protein [Gammaproteobacteria bacterium]